MPIAETDGDVYWEPQSFERGDRVRIQISPECPRACVCHRCGEDLPHVPEENGNTGTVAKVLDKPEGRRNGWGVYGHRYQVNLDREIPATHPCHQDGLGGYTVSIYAAVELEKLDGERDPSHEPGLTKTIITDWAGWADRHKEKTDG